MRAVEGALSIRAARCIRLWAGTAARYSLVGRSLLAISRAIGPAFRGGRAFGTDRAGSRRLGRTGHPVSVLVISRPYLRLRRTLGDGPLDRVIKGSEVGAKNSRFGGGAWIFLVGAGAFALGCGQLGLLLTQGIAAPNEVGAVPTLPGLRLVTPVILLLAGALVTAAGPRLIPAFRTSLVGRGIEAVSGRPVADVKRSDSATVATVGALAPRGRLVGILGAAILLAAAAGLVAGLTDDSGPVAMVAVVVVVCLVALALARPEIVLLAVAAFPWLDWAARRLFEGVGAAWDDALLVFSVVLLLWCVIGLRRWELRTVPIALPVLVALSAAIGSIVVRDVPGDVGLNALRVLFQPLLFYFLGFLFPKDRRWMRWIVTILIVSGVALALHGIYQYLTGAPMPASWVDVRETDIGTRAYSIIQNPNGLGACLLMGTLVSLSLALARGLRGLPRVLLGLACLVQAAGVAVTFSRGAWLGLGAGLLVLFIMAYRRYIVPLVAAGVVGWLVAPRAFVNRLAFGFSSAYITKSLAAGRLYVWKMSLQHIADHPWFGVGLGTFGGTTAVLFGYGRLWVDNFYLQLAAEGGLLLLAFFLWILLRAGKGLVKAHGNTQDPFLRALIAGAFGAFIAVAVANVTASVWETLVVGVGFWFLSGLVTSAALHENTEPAREPRTAASPGKAEPRWPAVVRGNTSPREERS